MKLSGSTTSKFTRCALPTHDYNDSWLFAFLAHEAAVFKLAILDHVDLCLWKEEMTVESMPVVNVSVQVPEKPGLGVTIDRQKLEKLTQAPRPRQGRFLVRMGYQHGFSVYFRFDPDADGTNLRFLNPPDVPGARLQRGTSGYANAVVTDFWDEAGSGELERLWKATSAGPVRKDSQPTSSEAAGNQQPNERSHS